MSRSLTLIAAVVAACICGRVVAHEPGEIGHHPCDASAGEACYYTFIDDYHAVDSPHPDATGEAFLTLNSDRTELSYSIFLDELLNLKPIEADRTEPDDILGIHLHLHVPDTLGPHLLNIFGWPAEEDNDLVIDYETSTLSGIYDISDASIDPATGQPYLQNLPLTSKIIYDWLDALDEGRLMLAVHTVASGFSRMAIHGHISPVVPEPATGVLAIGGIFLVWLTTRKARLAPTDR